MRPDLPAGRADFGERLRARRLSLGMTSEALAFAVGVGRHTVLAWESGRAMPSLLLLGRLGAVLRVPFDELTLW
ncbi:MAG: helix-turn-helix transcriptional regulator [Gloeomargaritaceae cyanobacterium C42_A2020_066]|nr:helix-turn-helix transcriptional regulator [Gloeomargaritaceae cyanobacterium C42_A2020_066]